MSVGSIWHLPHRDHRPPIVQLNVIAVRLHMPPSMSACAAFGAVLRLAPAASCTEGWRAPASWPLCLTTARQGACPLQHAARPQRHAWARTRASGGRDLRVCAHCRNWPPRWTVGARVTCPQHPPWLLAERPGSPGHHHKPSGMRARAHAHAAARRAATRYCRKLPLSGPGATPQRLTALPIHAATSE